VAQDAPVMNEDAPVITVVGIGADGMAGLGDAARAELRGATVIYGSRRQLDLLDDTVAAQRREWPSPLAPALEALRDSATSAHVVASGDPMLHGIGASLIKVLGPERVTVLPHVSSVTLACARMGWAVQDTEVISLMTERPHTAIRPGGQAIVLCRDGADPVTVARLITESGRGDSELSVLEQLGGPGECRRDGTARQWTAEGPGDIDPLNVLAVRYLPDERRGSALPDDAYAHDGQITKQMIRAVTLAALAPRPGELLWDVGSGSGSIAIEWCRSQSGCRAVSFERDDVRRDRLMTNVVAFGARVDVRGGAPDAFDGAPAPSAIFVGGGLTQPGLFGACWAALPAGGRLVANAVTAESEAAVVQHYSTYGGVLRRYQHYAGEPVGSFTGWHPSMPVTQWWVVKQ